MVTKQSNLPSYINVFNEFGMSMEISNSRNNSRLCRNFRLNKSMFDHSKRHDTQNQLIRSTDLKAKRMENTRMLGQRRKMVKSLLNLEAMQNAIEELMPAVDRNMHYSSEYNDNFCSSAMTQSMENDEIRMKYPLYGGSIQTVYGQLIMEGALKNHNAIADVNTPFRRNSVISLLPENNFNLMK